MNYIIKMVKKEGIKMVDIFHYNERTGKYKKLTVELDPKGRGAYISVVEGAKGDKDNIKRVVILCNKMELAYLIMELKEVYKTVGGGKNDLGEE